MSQANFDAALTIIYKVAADPSSNIEVQLSSRLQHFFSAEHGVDCSRRFRQRFAFILVNLERLRSASPSLDEYRVNKVIEAFLGICSRMMKQREESFWVFPLEKMFDPQLLKDSIQVLCNISPKKEIDAIEKLYNLSDESNGLTKHICEKIQDFIETSPLLVVEWIEAFKLYDFKKANLKMLTLSCLIKNVDFTKYLMTNSDFKDSVISILDSCLSRPVYPSNLEYHFYKKFNQSALSTLIFKHAHPDRIAFIPNTLEQRSSKNFEHNFSSAVGDERRVILFQTLEAAKNSSIQIKEIIRILKNRDETLASAAARYSKDYISAHDLLDVLPGYEYLTPSAKLDVDREMRELKNLQVIPPAGKIPYIKFEDFECVLVDDRLSFKKVLNALSYARVVAFDVEAAFVCQSSASTQDAALLQLAIKDSVFLVDVYVLKNELNEFEWETFFELFLRPKIRRVGFGIKNDVIFLQNAFPMLRKMFDAKKPIFVDVQEAVKQISNNPETLQTFFNGTAPNVSLQNITKELLDVELEKGQQIANWLTRPMDQKKMKYAATDALYTLKCYDKIRQILTKEQWVEMKQEICKVGEAIKSKSQLQVVAPSSSVILTKKKETFEDVVNHLQYVCESIMVKRKSSDCTIVLESPFFGIKNSLKRCGFKVWDHRDADPKPDKKAAQMIKDMERFLKNQPKEKRPTTFILSCKKTIPIGLMDFEGNLISAQQDQSESAILEKVVRESFSMIDFTSIFKRCSECAEMETHFTIPMNAYKLIFKTFATYRNFADKINGLEESFEKFIKVFNSMDIQDKGKCSIEGQEVLVEHASGIYKFSIDSSECAVLVNGVKFPYKCDTKVFENKYGRKEAKFCHDCKIFF